MKITYGTTDKLIDVTSFCLERLMCDNIITIPEGDITRARLLTDPIWGVVKDIFIEIDNVITVYNENTNIKINILTNTITLDRDILSKIHSKIKINHGFMWEELPEQKMAVNYLTGNEKVLEIGGNVGRNSLVIASILKDQKNLVVLESGPKFALQLRENRDLNNFNFHIEGSALSNRKLIQQWWETKPSEVLEPGFSWVNTISLDNLKKKYNIEFDTLVLDCEGAFYYILMDMPEILNNVNLIIMENDYMDITHKKYIDEILQKNNFRVHYSEAGGWGPCKDKFFEVWKRI